MKKLDVKIAYLSDDFKIIERNREFYTYFENEGFLHKNALDLVKETQQYDFFKFLKNFRNKKEFSVFKFKKITGEYFFNIAFVCDDVFNGKKYLSIRIIDIADMLAFYDESFFFEKCMNYALSLTNEYIFTYSKDSNHFEIHNFFHNRDVVVFNSDLDSWKTHFIDENLIEKNDVSYFSQKIEELKECRESFFMTIKSSLRSNKAMFETLNFKAERIDSSGVFMVGRIFPESASGQSEKSNSILEDLKIDSLTQVLNKKAITEFAKNRFVSGAKENALLAIVDLDRFKPVNDAYGHLAGDDVLRKAAAILKKIVGETGVVGRYGGDEFILVLENMDSESILRGVFRTINNDIRVAFANLFSDLKVTASIGSALFPKDGQSFEELFKKADFCLYRAKDKGRDRYVFFREDLHGELYKKASEAKTEGMKYDVREVLELKSMADFMLLLSENPKQASQTVLEHMLKTYNLGSINIYYGKEMQRKYCIGDKTDALSNAMYVYSSEFNDFLKEKPYIRVDFVTELSGTPFGKILESRGVKSSVQCVLGNIKNPKGLITFDRLKESALWAEYEVHCCLMFSAALNLLPESKICQIFE